jgi:hypothetical protein
MSADTWTRTECLLPPEHVEVEVVNGPYVQTLKRVGRLWFFPDMSMYVYFTPKWWRAVSSTEEGNEP